MKVLVVIPIRDRVEFVTEAIASVMTQTRSADEIVVTGNVDLERVPNLYTDWLVEQGPVRWIRSDDDLASRVNAVIRDSSCDVFILLCDDDKLEPTYIEKTVRLMQRYSDDIVYTDLQRFGGASHVMQALPWTEEQIELTTSPFVTSLCTKKRWALAGGYEQVPFFDWHFWWKCFHTGASAAHLKEPLFFYREHPGQDTYHVDLDQYRAQILELHDRTREEVKGLCRQ